MPSLNIVNSISCHKKEIPFEEGKSVMEILVDEGIYINNACGGKGTCGKCLVNVDGEQRLACSVFPKGDMTVELMEEREGRHYVLTSGYMPDFSFEPSVDLSGDEDKYGLAVDIGTTTVAAALVNLRSGDEMADASCINPQKIYGLDVLTRITFETDNPENGRKKLQKAIVDGLDILIEELCTRSDIERTQIHQMVVAANCTMLHMLLGVDATSIGVAPYTPRFVKAQCLPASEIGLVLAEDAAVYCLPSVSGYIGADIVAGAYVCGLDKTNENVLLIDIGTNGEMVLSRKGRMVSCSCAAGPALEGMNISCGMRAAEGAVEDIRITERGIEVKVIGDKEPEGICGSGILAAVRELLHCGFLRKNGAFIQKDSIDPKDYRYHMIRLDGKKRELLIRGGQKPLVVTQGDVRQVQLAKGAILSGVRALLKEAGIAPDELDKVMIAGQFGAHLPAKSLIETEILPREFADKIVYIGNSSKTGAYMALMSHTVRKEMEELAENIDYFDLATAEGYERLFSECINFHKE